MATLTKSRNPTVLGLGLVPNGYTLADFAIDTLCLATMTTLHLRVLHKTNSFSYVVILISCQYRLKKSIQNNLVSVATCLCGI